MNNLSILLTTLVVTPVALAQSPMTASTATDYAVFAADGTNTGFDSEASGTAIGRGLGVRAIVGGGPMRHPNASAATFVSPVMTRTGARGLRISEHGSVHSADPNASYSAGTSADAPNTQAPTQGAHDLALGFGVAQGTNGTVTIIWDARASAGASLAASIDVDGDGTADWTGTGAASDRQQIAVTAGANGVQLAISTDGSAAVTGEGHEGYGGALTVLFGAGGGGLNCSWTSYGPQCVGALAGSDAMTSRGLTLTLDVTAAAANGLGVLVVGDPLSTPLNLPGGNCQLLVDPGGNHLHAFWTDANGDASMTFRVPARPITTDFQAVTIGLANNGRIGSTNALHLVCR